MSKKIILALSLVFLIGIVVFVYAQDFSTEYGTAIFKGWNLVYGFYNPEQIQGLEASNIKAIYAFIPTTQEYARVYPDPENSKLNLIDDDELIQTAFWVYSNSETQEEFNGIYNGVEYGLYENPTPYDRRLIYKGWNFLGITSDMVGSGGKPELKDIAGSCNIEKAYFWDPENQEWWAFPLNEDFSRDSIGMGIVIKVSNNCNLGTSEDNSEDNNIPSVPNLPGNNRANNCTDSDGGLNYYVRGIATGTETLEDFCVNSTKLSEAICNNDQREAFAQYNCPNGCSNGACIQ